MFSRSIPNHLNIKQISSLHLIFSFPRIRPPQMAVQMSAREKIKGCLYLSNWHGEQLGSAETKNDHKM